MDLEELTTTQIVLLVLLVSFVTSIATGIVTVSLLAQAPPTITQTVNRVVERTVETIVPKDSGTQVITNKETTVVVKEDDLITDSISSSLLRTGRVYADTSTTSPVIGLAAAIGPTMIVGDRSITEGEHAVSFGNAIYYFKVSERFGEAGITILTPVSTSTSLANSFKIGDVNAVKLGQTAVALTSVTQERVQIGSVTSKQQYADVSKGSVKISVHTIDTNISAQLVPGVPLVNVFGDLIGIATSPLSGTGSFVSASDIVELVKTPKATTTAAE